MMKLQDILPSGLPQTYIRLHPTTGQVYSDFAINAVYDDGGAACCPYGMEIFSVESEADLYNEEMASKAPTVRHVRFVVNSNPPLTQEEMAERAKLRPDNFGDLSPKEQWNIDKSLGILDWNGR